MKLVLWHHRICKVSLPCSLSSACHQLVISLSSACLVTALSSAYSSKPYLGEPCVSSVVSSTHSASCLGHFGSHMHQGLLLSQGPILGQGPLLRQGPLLGQGPLLSHTQKAKEFSFGRQETDVHYTGCGRGQPASSPSCQHPKTQPFTLPVPPLPRDRMRPQRPCTHWKMPWLCATALVGLQCNGARDHRGLLSGELCSCACMSCHHCQFLRHDARQVLGSVSQWLKVCWLVVPCWNRNVAVRGAAENLQAHYRACTPSAVSYMT